MISKEDFYKVWKDSAKESILNQFYYEHNDLRELLKENGNKEEVIKRQQEVIGKAIEYINKNKKVVSKYEAKDTRLPLGTFMWGVDNLLNILQNGDESNEYEQKN